MENCNPQKIIVITYNASTYLMSNAENNTTDILYDRISKEIENNGYIWFPWKNRAETFPENEKDNLRAKNYEIYLLNKGEKKQLYHINATEFNFGNEKRDIGFTSVNGEKVIDEFKNTKSQMWMRIDSIEQVEESSKFLKHYSFISDIDLGYSEQFKKDLWGKRVFGRSFLIKSEYCIFFLRQDPDAKTPKDFPLKPNQSKYAKTFTPVDGNNILMLSDLHCPFEETPDRMSSLYMQTILSNAKDKKPAGLIVAGDFSDKNKSEGYDEAVKFISKLCVQNNIKNEAVVFVPGNHDIAFSNDTEFDYSAPEYRIQYVNFYKELLSCDPGRSLCRGSKFVLKNGLPVEVLGLNSVPYSQDEQRRSFGVLINDHLNNIAERMGWKKNEKTYSYRILVFHHPLFPVGDRNTLENSELKQEVIINAKTVHNFIQKYGIDLVITGHAHTDGHLKFIREGVKDGICVWLGLGSCGAQDNKEDGNAFYCLDFNDYGKVKLYRAEHKNNFEWNTEPMLTFDLNL